VLLELLSGDMLVAALIPIDDPYGIPKALLLELQSIAYTALLLVFQDFSERVPRFELFSLKLLSQLIQLFPFSFLIFTLGLLLLSHDDVFMHHQVEILHELGGSWELCC
jgi:hypothetical protein